MCNKAVITLKDVLKNYLEQGNVIELLTTMAQVFDYVDNPLNNLSEKEKKLYAEIATELYELRNKVTKLIKE